MLGKNGLTLKRKRAIQRISQRATGRIQRSRGFVKWRLCPRRREARQRLGVGAAHCHGNQRRVVALVTLVRWLRPVSLVYMAIRDWLEKKNEKWNFSGTESVNDITFPNKKTPLHILCLDKNKIPRLFSDLKIAFRIRWTWKENLFFPDVENSSRSDDKTFHLCWSFNLFS